MKALVVDDSRTVRSIVRPMLEELGYSVTEAADGGEGLDRLDGGAALVLCDWDMPGMDGPSFVRELRRRLGASGAGGGPRVVMVTKHTRLDDVRAAIAAGADEYLMKPFTREMLVDKLALAESEER